MAAYHSTEMHVCMRACVPAREGAAAVAAAGALPDLAALAQHGSPAERSVAKHAVANLLAGGGGGGGDGALLSQVRAPLGLVQTVQPVVPVQAASPDVQVASCRTVAAASYTTCHQSEGSLALCGAAVAGSQGCMR